MKLNFRFVSLIFAAIFGISLSLPSLFPNFFTSGPKISLGLDLQGGLHLLLGVKVDDVISAKYANLASTVNFSAKSEKILLSELKIIENPLKQSTGVRFSLLDPDDAPKINEILRKIDGLKISQNAKNYELNFTSEHIKESKKSAISQAITTIRNRLDQFGLSEPSVTQQGADSILVELPGIKSIEEENRARDLISRTALLQLMAVDEERNIRVNEMSPAQAENFGDVILQTSDGYGKMLVKKVPILDGSKITDARVVYDENHEPVVSFTLDSLGARIFGDFSGANIGKRMAIVLDGKISSAPVIRQRIGGGSGQISGNFTAESASDLAITLRSGSLPVSLNVLEKRSIGPSLGEESIRTSLFVLCLGFVLVAAFMILYYAGAGVVSVCALVINLFIILAVMALFGATLTLPGMAGIILTVGIAVDANIIINERIREGIYAGENIIRALNLGYENASRAIFDSNITSLIASFLLYVYGTGAIKGFAITTAIGIVASIITAIVGTQGFYQIMAPKISRSKNLSLWFGVHRLGSGKGTRYGAV